MILCWLHIAIFTWLLREKEFNHLKRSPFLTCACLMAVMGSLESLVMVCAATMLLCSVPVAMRRDNSTFDIRCNTHDTPRATKDPE